MFKGVAALDLLRTGAIACCLTACSTQTVPIPHVEGPGFGEIMASIGNRHSKLWFAGQAGNWALADYEIEEIKESLEDLGRFHPTHKTVPGSVPQMLTNSMGGALDALERSIKSRDVTAFAERYDDLTRACNGCHEMTNFGFLRLVRPTTNTFSNLEFRTGR